jgi:hypothetical protein
MRKQYTLTQVSPRRYSLRIQMGDSYVEGEPRVMSKEERSQLAESVLREWIKEVQGRATLQRR